MASYAFAPPCARRASPAKASPIQAKLEVGPSHDRFEAEADRVAQSVLSSTGPSSAPSISPLGSGSATRKPMQREEQRPIAKREEDKTDQSKSGLTKILQPKSDSTGSLEDQKKGSKKGSNGKVQTKASTAAKPKKEEPKAQKKGLDGALRPIQAKSNPRPKEEEKKAQAKPANGAVAQPKADPRPQEEDKVQKKSLTGTLQRDNVDEDTILETSVQTKRLAGAVQREVAKADAVLATEEKEETKKPEAAPVQRAASSADGFTAPSSVEAGIASMQGGGMPLAAEVRNDLEPRFGRDLSGVRIHDGTRAGELSNSVSARAFTIGQDIFFGAGQYQPKTSGGRALLAHELTHTIQQQGGSSRAQPSRIQRVDKPSAGAASVTTQSPPAGTPPPQQDVEPFKHPKGEIHVGPGRMVIKMRTLPLPMLGGRAGAERAPKGTGTYASPPIIASREAPWEYRGKQPRGGETARQVWLGAMDASNGAREAVIKKKTEKDITAPGGKEIAYLRSKDPGEQNFLMVGTPTELAKTPNVKLPIWNDKGEATLFDVDHVRELQLGGAHAMSNFWLLDQGSNRSAGTRIKNEMRDDFNELIDAALKSTKSSKASGGQSNAPAPAGGKGGTTSNWFLDQGVSEPKWDYFRSNRNNHSSAAGGGQASGTQASGWTIEYLGTRNIQLGETGTGAHWTKADIEQGKHLEKLVQLSPKEIRDRGLIYAIGTNNVKARIYVGPTGGFFRTINYGSKQTVQTVDKMPGGAAGTGKGVAGNQFWKGFAVGAGGIEMTTMPAGPDGEVRTLLGNAPLTKDAVIATISGQPFPASGKITADPIEDMPVLWKEEFGFGGHLAQGWLTTEKMGRLAIEGASPIELQEAGITPQGELFANGAIVATKSLFPDLHIPIFLRGNDIFVSFPIPTNRLNFGPVKVTEAAIDIGYGLDGLFLSGRAGLAVDRVGKGTVEAKATKSDTILKGEFMFDMDFLKNPSAGFEYSFAKDTLKLTLKTDVDKGKLPGVESGHVEGEFSREAISLTGTLNLAPPLQGSQIILGYTEKEGIVIAANDIPLPISKIPGITDAKLSAKASMNPDDGEWHVSGTGSATFSMPPATGTLTVGLDGTRLMITGSAGFQQGIASGTVNVTATNAQLDEAGQPIPDKVADKFSIWGSGTASLKFGILTGTAGLKLKPDGSVIIDGEIALPPTHEVFKKQSYEKQLIKFSPPEFPIWGVSIAGYGIGIMGFVDAKLNFDAYVGPGTLNDTKVKVTFALDKPEEAVVDGNAAFVVPAGAGFTLDIGGGLSARAAVGYVKGRVGLDARLGLEAMARADVSLHWTQMEGLSLAAKAHAEAHPRFDIGVNASVTAGVDLLLTEIEHTWGPWRKRLGSFGPELSVGITAPIAWSEKSGLDFSTDKIEIQKPEIDFAATMKDAFLELV